MLIWDITNNYSVHDRIIKKDKNQLLKSHAFSCQNPYCVTHTSGSDDIGENPAHR